MADYNDVVEMWEKNLASLLELAKKWLVEWEVDFKKLLHLLQNIRKDDLLGLIAGTHEIKIKKLKTKKSVEKFVLLADLGEIVIPDDFNHKTWLASFKKKNYQENFEYYNGEITDINFSNPTRVLKPGDKFHLRIFEKAMPGNITSEECLEFLATQKTIYTGAQGASLVWEQKRDQLPKGYWYCSFDEKERLYKNQIGDHKMPYIDAAYDEGFEFSLSSFENDLDEDVALLCFNEITE